MQELLITLGLILFLLGLLTGLAVPVSKNPQMGLASHLQGMTNGPFLVVLGLLWPRLDLSRPWEVVTVVLVVYGTYANWLATQLGAWWGAGHRYAPSASGSYRASPAKEQVVDTLLVTLAPAMIAGTLLLVIGVLR